MILKNSQNGYRRNRSTISPILTIRRILEGVRAKKLEATILFDVFSKAFDPMLRGKTEANTTRLRATEETFAAIMMLYKNTKVKVRSPDGGTDYFDNVAGMLQGDTLAPYLFIICLDYVLRTSIDKMKDNGFMQAKERRRYTAQTITDTGLADNIALLANTPAQAKSVLHSLERAAAGIDFHVNADKIEYIYFNQTGDISNLSCTFLKLVNKFTYLGKRFSSTETNINTRQAKA